MDLGGLFESSPDNYSRTAILWDGGWLEVDACFRQDLTIDSEVTEHPVEPGTGTAITDHVQPSPIEIGIDVIVTNKPAKLPLTHADSSVESTSDEVVTLKRPLLPVGPSRIGIGVATIPLESAKQYKLGAVVYEPALQRVKNAIEELLSIRNEARLCTLSIPVLGDFDSMVLRSIHVQRTAQNGQVLEATLTFRQITLADSNGLIVGYKSAEPPSPDKKSSAEVKNAGRAAAKVASEADATVGESLLSQVLGG